jgi:hypothetical protein
MKDRAEIDIGLPATYLSIICPKKAQSLQHSAPFDLSAPVLQKDLNPLSSFQKKKVVKEKVYFLFV